MSSLLIKLFIKNSENTASPAVRKRYGFLAGIVGIICNLVLFALKLFVGIISGSVSIAADAFNNLSDMGSSVISMLGFRMALKPADPDHPYGHGRFEYISALIVSGLIIIMGFELIKSSVEKLINGGTVSFSAVSVVILSVSILIKLWLFLFNRKLASKISSEVLKATARDSLNDALTTFAILVSVVLSLTLNVNVDAYLGIALSLFIMWTGFKTAKEALNPLLGEPLQKQTAEEIEQTIMSFEGFLGIHDLVAHNYGPGRCFASVHVEVPANTDIINCHEQIDLCEKLVLTKLGIQLTIHMDPVETDNEKLTEAKNTMAEKIREIDPRLSIHDFRMTPKSDMRTNLIFDVVLPAEESFDKRFLKAQIEEIAREIDSTYCCVITFDIDFTAGK